MRSIWTGNAQELAESRASVIYTAGFSSGFGRRKQESAHACPGSVYMSEFPSCPKQAGMFWGDTDWQSPHLLRYGAADGPQTSTHKSGAVPPTQNGWAAQPQALTGEKDTAARKGELELKKGWNKRKAAEKAIDERQMLICWLLDTRGVLWVSKQEYHHNYKQPDA